MRLGVDVTILSKSKAGISQYLNAMLTELDRLEIELVLFGPQNLLFDLGHLRNAKFYLRGSNKSIFSRIMCRLRLIRTASMMELDAFWGPANFLLPLPRNTFKIVTIHDFVFLRCPETMRTISRLFHKVSIPMSIDNADVILVPCQTIKDEYLQYVRGNTQKVFTISPASRFRPKDHNDEQCGILFVGTFEPRKNIVRLLKAYSQLPFEIKEEHSLTLCGREGWKMSDLSEFIASLKIESNVKIVRDADDSKLAELYQETACVILPSFYEGFGMPIVEAHSFGKPVIASNIGAISEVLGDGGVRIDPDSITSMQDAMHQILVNRSFREVLKDNALENAKRFSWSNSAKSFLAILNDHRMKV